MNGAEMTAEELLFSKALAILALRVVELAEGERDGSPADIAFERACQLASRSVALSALKILAIASAHPDIMSDLKNTPVHTVMLFRESES